ncbi:MAG: hypothetical protein CVV27_11720 [Candidatus Melainabacteria bacterium HGW-Melainabacteria-1]|nr:MAG: hypothetical protein CVV27_11720 [Candidatus Melainabacteria bacterium HGW-Melainabacteria-1]
MTDTRTKLELLLLLLAVSIFIFFTPFLLGSKQPALEASVKQNMDFLQEMVKKYIEQQKHPPASLAELVRHAREKRYNKTLFNPVLKNTGDAIDRQVVEVYSEALYQSLGAQFTAKHFAGKTGYYTDGVRYAIYGHLANGELLQRDGRVLSLSNH